MEFKASYQQERLWFIDISETGNLYDNGPIYHNMPLLFQVKGEINAELLEKSIKAVIDRHEALRTQIITKDSQPFQEVAPEAPFKLQRRTLTDYAGDDKNEYASALALDFARQPFLLSADFLCRGQLIEISGDEFILVMSIHHIIADRYSLKIIAREIFAFYDAFRKGTTPDLPILSAHYADFSLWQHDLSDEILEPLLLYWKRKMKGNLQPLQLPTDYPRAPIQVFHDGARQFKITGDLYAKIEQFCRQRKISKFPVLLATFKILLNKYAGQEEIIVGIYEENRDLPGLEHIVGPIANLLPLRSFLNEKNNFLAFLEELEKTIEDARKNKDLPFDKLVLELAPPKDTSRNVFFDIFFHYDENPGKVISSDHIEIKIPDANLGYGKYDFNLLLENDQNSKSVTGVFVFNKDYYDGSTIDRFIGHYLNLLDNILEKPESKISDLYFLTETEKNKLLYEFNDTAGEIPARKTIQRLFEEQVENSPDRIALCVGHVRHVPPVYLTYHELNERANRLAHVLIRKGVGPDIIVGIMMDSSSEMMVGVLAILKAGGAFLPIDSNYPRERIKMILDDCRAAVLLTDSNNVELNSLTLLQGYPYSMVEIQITSPRPPIKDLDSLQIADRSLVDYEKYGRDISEAMVKYSIAMQATRGCPYNCAYCCRLWPRTFVTRSAESIFEEVKVYYQMGVRRFAFYDDIFNLDVKNSSRFFNMIIDGGIKVQFFFSTGFRGDILSKDYIDLVVRAGAVNISLSLETASPRIQKLMRKNLNLKRFRENVKHICEKHPHVIVELQLMHGFPTETEEEAMMSLDFVKSMRWIDFPYINVVKIHANTDIEKIALENGVSREAIENSRSLAYHELPDTLPFDKNFTVRFQAEFLNDYFLAKKRLLEVLPYQLKILTRDELVQKYNSYLPIEINSFESFLEFVGITQEELGVKDFLEEEQIMVPNLNEKMKKYFHPHGIETSPGALRILLLDLTQFFSGEHEMLYDILEPPLGLMYLMTYLNRHFGGKIAGKIAKSRIDFNNFEELKTMIEEFKPHIIGIRSMTFYKELFHRTTAMIRLWDANIPVITGGPYATSNYQTVLKDRNVDLVVLGEGEETLCELIEKMMANNNKMPDKNTLNEIRGIAYVSRASGNINKFARDIIMLDNPNLWLSAFPSVNPSFTGSSSNLAYTIFTSGSTGRPKGVMIEHRNVIRLVKNTNYIDFRPGDRLLKTGALEFDASTFEIWGSLLNGLTLYLESKENILNPTKLKKIITDNHITIMWLTSNLFNQMAQVDVNIFVGLRYLLVGGDVLSPSHINRVREYFPHLRIINGYGPTENTTFSTTALIETEYKEKIPIGKPIANSSVYIVDGAGKLQPIGIAGEIWVGGEGVSRGYLNNPLLTSEKFKRDISNDQGPITNDRFYKTGDLGRWLADGNIEFFGRIDTQVKVRGYRIELGEIENQLLNYRAVKNAVVLDRQDINGDKYLCAYVVTDSPGLSTSSQPSGPDPSSDLRQYLAVRLPDYMLPTYFIQVDKIPLNENGKVDLKALPEPGSGGEADYVAPRNDIEWNIAYIISEVTGIDAGKISIRANIFDIGVNSITLVRIAHRIAEDFNTPTDISSLFSNSTVEKIAVDVQKKFTPKAIKRIILLNRGDAEQNLFLQSGNGGIYIFKELARLLEGRYNVYGILARGIYDNSPLPQTREELFLEYIREIKTIQPQGPYLLGGHCFGAIISYELVRNLEDMGEQVKKLIVLDEPAFMTEFVVNHFTRFLISKKIRKIKQTLKRVFKTKAGDGKGDNSLQETDENVNFLLETPEARTEEVVKNFRRLFSSLWQYSRIINTPILLLKALQQKYPDDPRWNPQVIVKQSRQAVEIFDTPGDHLDMFKSPHVETLAKLVLEKI